MKDFFLKLKQMYNVRDLFFVALVFGLMLVFAFCESATLMDVTFGETAVDITAKRYTMNIPYELVESIEIGEICPDDDLLQGKYDFALRTGLWTNEEWGEYYACMDLAPKTCIMVHLNDGRLFVFSHQSDKTVAEEFETLQDYVDAAKE